MLPTRQASCRLKPTFGQVGFFYKPKELKIIGKATVSQQNSTYLYKVVSHKYMTRKEIDAMIQISEGQVQYALYHLRQILEHGEAKGQEVRWTKLLIGHKDLIEVLRRLKADDE